jgi:hypothetical protein
LIGGLTRFLRTTPHFALSNESSAALILDADICLAFLSESLSSRAALVMAIEVRHDEVTQFLLTMLCKGLGCRFE